MGVPTLGAGMGKRRLQQPSTFAVAFLCMLPASLPDWQPAGRSADPRTAAAVGNPCPGDPIKPDKVIDGSFSTDLEGSYVMVPFKVPKSATAFRVKYCFDQPEATTVLAKNTVDLGLWEPAPRGRDWGRGQFRGWGGSSHPDVTISPRGFSSRSKYMADPKGDVYGHTTRGFEPGPVPAGRWAVELGLGSVVPPALGNPDGEVAWRVEIDLIKDKKLQRGPGYRPARYDESPARAGPGWYAGDLHVHGDHSALGDAPMDEVFDDAFRPLSKDGAGLDFVTLSDYVSDSAWGEIGRHQADYPGKLIDRSAEVITYRGHIGNHASVRYVDHRTGPVYRRSANGNLAKLRGARPASDVFEQIRRAGGFTQINHPTIFPNAVPTFSGFCRGCEWDYSPRETDYAQVDAIEIATGPPALAGPVQLTPNPFTLTAIDFYQRALATGNHVAAVGVSDAHKAGRKGNPITGSQVGIATTVLYAQELSEAGISKAVRAGHTYVKIFGNSGPDLRFSATAGGKRAIIGDTLKGTRAQLTAEVTGAKPDLDMFKGSPYVLELLRDGAPVRILPVTGVDQSFEIGVLQPGRYQLQLLRGTGIVAYTSPIYLEP